MGSIGDSPRRSRPGAKVSLQCFEDVLPPWAPKISGTSVSVKVASQQFGRLESSILADARGRASDVRIPTFPKHCEVGRVCVPRRPGYMGLGAADAPWFERLRRIFPILHGWVPWSGPASGNQDGLSCLPLERSEEARYNVAQSVLLLNVAGDLPDSMLVDAAQYGVLCVGTAASEAQMRLWPELAIRDGESAVSLARSLLTNAAHFRRLSARARSACDRFYAPNEEDSVECLRQLHAAHVASAVPAGR